MPQIIPYFFLNQLTFALFGLFIVVFLAAKYFLPAMLSLQVVRTYITKL